MASFKVNGVAFHQRATPPNDQFIEVIGTAIVGGVMAQVFIGSDDREYAFAPPQRGRREALWMDVNGYSESRVMEQEEVMNSIRKMAELEGWNIGGMGGGCGL